MRFQNAAWSSELPVSTALPVEPAPQAEPQRGWLDPLLDWLAGWGELVLETFAAIGDFSLFFFHSSSLFMFSSTSSLLTST